MKLELDAEEERALVMELRRLVADGRYPFSARIRTLKGILDKVAPPPVREPLPSPKVYAPPPRRSVLDDIGEQAAGRDQRTCSMSSWFGAVESGDLSRLIVPAAAILGRAGGR
jgi:hypothetical protein